jgi:regulator of sirC expression with transglutaminase-like and TPR domain
MDQKLLDDFERCAADPEADELTMAVLIARVLDPEVRAEAVKARLDDLTIRHASSQPPWQFLREQGFAGNAHDYASLDNSNIAWVLENRRGIPISLAVVLIRLARAAGHDAMGLNFPGHFLVQVGEVIIDPFAMKPVTRGELTASLPPDSRAQPESQLFAPAPTLAVGLRMLNNIKAAHWHAGAWHRALDAVDAQLRLAPQLSALHLERGDLWLRVGLAQPARVAYAMALTLAGRLPPAEAGEVRRVVEARLDQIGDVSDTIH